MRHVTLIPDLSGHRHFWDIFAMGCIIFHNLQTICVKHRERGVELEWNIGNLR